MLKETVRSALRSTKKWLEKENGAAAKPLGVAPFSYTNLNRLLGRLARQDGGLDRPAYAWGVLQGLNLAKVLGQERVSLIELGVAGGNGLVALERLAQKLQPIFGVEMDIFGFDRVAGLPRPQDHRDLPNLWSQGWYVMDKEKLERRLKKARLVLGPIEETAPRFLESERAPIAFIAFDLCFYSSTTKAFQILEGEHRLLLPRVHCFFRNVLGRTLGDHNGELLAISDFNDSHETRKISKIHGLQYYLASLGRQRWVEQFYMAHVFDHVSYGSYDGLIDETALDLYDE